jgi:hypothetical protein
MTTTLLLVFNDGSWYARRVRLVEHDLTVDEKVYRCDAHLAGPHETVEQVVQALRQKGYATTA